MPLSSISKVVHPTDTLIHHPIGILQYPFDDPAREHQYFTLEGRLEFRKDYKGVLWAASQTPGIYRLDFNAADFSVSCSWCLTHDAITYKEAIEFVAEYVNTFISKLKLVIEGKVQEFKDMGIEPHVFLESLKPVDVYDGDRNGPWPEYR